MYGQRRRELFLKVSATWVWLIFGPGLMILILSKMWSVGVSEAIIRLYRILSEKPYLASYVEIVYAGLLPLLFTLADREDPRKYGFHREGALRSVALSTPLAVLIALLRGPPPFSYGLNFPWNVYYAVLTLTAYGPLEVFFVIWLVENMDSLLDGEGLISDGLLITVSVYGLLHAFCITCLNISAATLNALMVTVVLFVLTVIYKYTGNALGFVISWTIINRQSLLAAIECLM